MKSSYKKIGDYIQIVNSRNTNLHIQNLIGVTLDKKFIKSVANIVGADMSKYKVIKNGQFACKLMSVGRDKKLPVSYLFNSNPAIVSSAYYVFEIIDKTLLLDDYLMMWLRRPETDRYLGFISGGDVRGSISWEDFCSLDIIIPSIEKQKEIVKEYYTIVNRIKLNETLNQKLEETAQAIYKQWFVDFEFPDENGKPYKSNGREMVWNEELGEEIPKGWYKGNFENIAKIEDGDRGKNYPSQEEFYSDGYCLFLGASNVGYTGFRFDNNVFITEEKDNLLRSGKLQRHDIVLTSRGSTIGKLGYYSNLIDFAHIRINSGMLIFRAKNETCALFLFTFLKSFQFQNLVKGFLSGSAQPQLPIRDLVKIPILIPSDDIILNFSKYIKSIQRDIDLRKKMNSKLLLLKDILHAKMTKVEQEKEVA